MAPPEKKDDRGIAFGAAGGYDDIYSGGGGGGDNGDLVASLPTADEERRMKSELEDEGRVASHPSTMAAARNEVRLELLFDGIRKSMPEPLSMSLMKTVLELFREKNMIRSRTQRVVLVLSIPKLLIEKRITKSVAIIAKCEMRTRPSKMQCNTPIWIVNAMT